MKFIGISGNSGSGKTFILNKIREKFGYLISVISLDNYYKPLFLQEKDENGFENFDLPSAIDHLKLLNDIETLKQNKEVVFPVYHFNNPNKKTEFETIVPNKIILIEGIFCFNYQELQNIYSLKVFIDTPTEITFERRLKRDILERGLTEEKVRYQWENHALPGFLKYVLPHKESSDLIINHQDFESDLNSFLFEINKLILNHD